MYHNNCPPNVHGQEEKIRYDSDFCEHFLAACTLNMAVTMFGKINFIIYVAIGFFSILSQLNILNRDIILWHITYSIQRFATLCLFKYKYMHTFESYIAPSIQKILRAKYVKFLHEKQNLSHSGGILEIKLTLLKYLNVLCII